MTVSIKDLHQLRTIPKLIYHSLDCALYQVSVMTPDGEQMVTDGKGKLLRSHSLITLQAMFDDFPVAEQVLRQQSAYDEMVNQPVRSGSNQLEVPLGNNGLA